MTSLSSNWARNRRQGGGGFSAASSLRPKRSRRARASSSLRPPCASVPNVATASSIRWRYAILHHMAFTSILCPVDFSEPARSALRWASALAARYDGQLTVMTVVNPMLAEAVRIRLGKDLVATDTEPALRKFVAGLEGARAPKAMHVVLGEPVSAILDAATGGGAGLIVVGTHGLGGFKKWLLGSTTSRMLRRTTVPVLAVPPSSSDPNAGRLSVANILVATDFSEPATAAVTAAATLARDLSAAITLLHVIEPVTVPPQWQSLMEEPAEARAATARARLKTLADLSCAGLRHDTVVSSGRAAETITATAVEHRADLIVMGLTGDQGMVGPRPGTIAYRVLCSAHVPVLVLPQ